MSSARAGALPLLFAFCLIHASLESGPAARGAAYDEAVLGDLSGTPATPTAWMLDAGSNVLSGAAGFTGPFDVDIVSFTIPTGLQLDKIFINTFRNDFGLSFFGLQPGTPWNNGVGGQVSADPLIGYALIDNESVTTNLLATMQTISAPPLYDIPLASGVYTLEFQDLDTGFSYALDFQTSLVETNHPGDFDGDGTVDAADLAQWIADFGANADSDADADGDTDGADFLIWQQNLGSGSPANAAPEPTAASLMLAAAALLRQRRPRCPSRPAQPRRC